MFGSNFLKIRKKFALTLTDVDVSLKEYKNHKIRSTIVSNAISVSENTGNNSYLIDVPAKIYYKSIYTEFELYYVRSLIQFRDFYALNETVSESWKFTTFYYFIFFSNVSLQRLLQKGYLYFDEENIKLLNITLTTFLPFIVNEGKGNWHFKKKNETSSVVTIELKKVGSNIHQLVWQDLKGNLKTFLSQTSGKKNDSEISILQNLIDLINSNKDFSPSETRNYLNYVSEIAIDEVENKIKCPQIKIENFIKTLSSFEYNQNISSKITLSILIGHYIHLFNSEIIEDLESRNSKIFKLKKKHLAKK